MLSWCKAKIITSTAMLGSPLAPVVYHITVWVFKHALNKSWPQLCPASDRCEQTGLIRETQHAQHPLSTHSGFSVTFRKQKGKETMSRTANCREERFLQGKQRTNLHFECSVFKKQITQIGNLTSLSNFLSVKIINEITGIKIDNRWHHN